MKLVHVNNKTRGLSLIELLVGLAISSILAIGIISMYSSSKSTFYTETDSSKIQESGRFVYSMLISDLRRTGYFGYNPGVETILGTEGVLVNANTCPADATWAQMIDRRVTGLDDPAVAYNCITNYLAGSGDVITLRYVDGRNEAAFDNNRYYLRSSFKSGRLFTGVDAADALNTINDGSPESTGRLQAYAYYVGNSGRTCRFDNNIAIPTLYRMSLDATGTPQRQEVATGIENIQFKYGVDTSGDGSVNQYFDASNIANDNTAAINWNKVVAVQFWVLARAECPDAKLVSRTVNYDMGGANPVAITSSFKRQLFTSTVALRNN
ncbi:hypothetical protein MNBD_GAMMA22-2637 [hydrothermal vent metagenome]|uniref:Type IV fimbrial biogenesis protein PilW n=1 Tax=hydrothermal vent metagenome TaxID=652676 RepID=A0A3B1ABL2_9ZZZZ